MVSDHGYRCIDFRTITLSKDCGAKSTDFVLLPIVIERKVLETNDTVVSLLAS